MYNEQMMLSLKKVEANRAANTELQPRRMTADEKDELLRTYHPDYPSLLSDRTRASAYLTSLQLCFRQRAVFAA